MIEQPHCQKCGSKRLQYLMHVWVKKDNLLWIQEGWCLNCVQDVNADYHSEKKEPLRLP